MSLYFSFIIPVYNRPQEIKELLDSFSQLKYDKPYEILIIEDGSIEKSDEVIKNLSSQLNIKYFFKNNSGPGDSRNYGMQRADGNYFIILDSDCLLPPQYLNGVEQSLSEDYLDCFGGPDAAHHSFTPLQKAINYVMTSFLTTGGIRGRKKSIQQFEPRSFNMGISKQAFDTTGGFGKIHPGEDPDLSQRLLKAGFKTGFIEKAFVYHKRRISWSKFYKQVRKFGLVRPILTKWHPTSARISFWFPFLFVLFTVGSIFLSFFKIYYFLGFLLLYILILLLDSSIKNKSLYIGFLSILAMFIQFFGYGLAFAKSTFYIRVLNQNPEKRFPELFFK
ncbi:glycosyltransferase [Planktosalinus lacus]|uniref:Glycosyl transferase family 2 n=1 Tax=Planktosalinus lacus TaxID=1526573 RepID=A0A8J2Y9C1_9FLAO|nr:glycosyltransferase [Planktosalinus lacus]GGD91505.1 glycosyl transferase family 2 [Planktosalinus lacus]